MSEIEEMYQEGQKRQVARANKELEALALENCKQVTIQRNRDKQKEQERNDRLNRFYSALCSFMEDC